MQKHSIILNDQTIEFEIKKNRGRKTVAIFIDPSKGVYVRAPHFVSENKIKEFVISKANWILEKQEKIIKSANNKKYITGEEFLFLGKPVSLNIITYEKRKREKAELTESGFVVYINQEFDENKRIENIKKNLIKCYKAKAEIILKQKLQFYTELIDVDIPEIKLSNATRYWGLCNSTRWQIRFNWHLILAPETLIEYIAAHEVCHLKYPNHSKQYWAFLGSILPDYRQRRFQLKQEGYKYCFY
jgi:predicted metal-dependent hydrolase